MDKLRLNGSITGAFVAILLVAVMFFLMPVEAFANDNNANSSGPDDLTIASGVVVDKKSGEVKAQIKLGESAQLFIIENLGDIVSTT
mgnify:CR=1 FL=1